MLTSKYSSISLLRCPILHSIFPFHVFLASNSSSPHPNYVFIMPLSHLFPFSESLQTLLSKRHQKLARLYSHGKNRTSMFAPKSKPPVVMRAGNLTASDFSSVLTTWRQSVRTYRKSRRSWKNFIIFLGRN